VLPTLDAIGRSLVESPGMYWANLLVTCQEIVIGAGQESSSASCSLSPWPNCQPSRRPSCR
jgi:hypothetical protein